MKRAVVLLACLAVAQAGLLRVPKVYNALVTTKEKLVPSRAYSVSAPVFQPVGLTPALPIIPIAAVPEPEEGAEDTIPPAMEPAEPAAPEKDSDDSEKKTEAESKTNIHPIVPPIALPVAYYNSLTYYHSIWPHAYSAISPAYVFTAPFTYPGILSDFYAPLLPGKKPGKEQSASAKSAESSDLPEGAKVDAENDSVSVETS